MTISPELIRFEHDTLRVILALDCSQGKQFCQGAVHNSLLD